MLRLIHTSDWHLGHELYGYDRIADHRDFLSQLRDIVHREQPDALIVSGDIYNTAVPSNAVMTLFHASLAAIHRACPPMRIIVTAGNHDSPSRLEVSGSVWHELGGRMIGSITRDPEGNIDLDSIIIDINDATGNLKGIIVALPYIYSGSYPVTDTSVTDRDGRRRLFFEALDRRLKERQAGCGVPVVMSSHIAVTGCDTGAHDECGGMEFTGLESIAVDFDYLALGHIHCLQSFGRGNSIAAYCGTPVAVSFDEKETHCVNIVEIDSHGSVPRIKPVEIVQRSPLLTIPSDGSALSFDKALEILEKWDSDAFLRMSVLIDDVPPPHAIERAHKAATHGKGKFCTFRWVRPDSKPYSANEEIASYSVDEFKTLIPSEIAKKYYADKTGTPMPDVLCGMFDEILREVMNHETD